MFSVLHCPSIMMMVFVYAVVATLSGTLTKAQGQMGGKEPAIILIIARKCATKVTIDGKQAKQRKDGKWVLKTDPIPVDHVTEYAVCIQLDVIVEVKGHKQKEQVVETPTIKVLGGTDTEHDLRD